MRGAIVFEVHNPHFWRTWIGAGLCFATSAWRGRIDSRTKESG